MSREVEYEFTRKIMEFCKLGDSDNFEKFFEVASTMGVNFSSRGEDLIFAITAVNNDQPKILEILFEKFPSLFDKIDYLRTLNEDSACSELLSKIQKNSDYFSVLDHADGDDASFRGNVSDESIKQEKEDILDMFEYKAIIKKSQVIKYYLEKNPSIFKPGDEHISFINNIKFPKDVIDDKEQIEILKELKEYQSHLGNIIDETESEYPIILKNMCKSLFYIHLEPALMPYNDLPAVGHDEDLKAIGHSDHTDSESGNI